MFLVSNISGENVYCEQLPSYSVGDYNIKITKFSPSDSEGISYNSICAAKAFQNIKHHTVLNVRPRATFIKNPLQSFLISPLLKP